MLSALKKNLPRDFKKRLILGLMLLTFVNIFNRGAISPIMELLKTREPAQAEEQPAPESQLGFLENQAQGYEKVLEREPNNRTALEGLMDLRIQMGDLEGALEPLAKLRQLDPDNPSYQTQQAALEAELAQAQDPPVTDE